MAILKTGTTIGGNTAWHSGNDGAGSGLDADLLDGINGGSFLRSDATTTYSGGLFRVTTPAGATGNNTAEVNTLQLFQPNTGTDAYMSFHVSGDYAVHFGLDGSTNDLFVGGWSMGNNRYKVYHAGNVPTWNQNTTGSAGSVANSVTFTSSGGAAAGTTYNGSAARTIDYATVGAAAASHTHSYLPLTGGDLSNGDSVTLEMRPNDAGQAYFKVGRSLNGSQGTGIIEVTQDGSHGGGFYYNGDGSPQFISGEASDTITFYRMNGGAKSRVFQYGYGSDTVDFTATPTVNGTAVSLSNHGHSYLSAESDTLATVTARGNTANAAICVPAGESNAYGFWGGTGTYGISMGQTASIYQYGPVTDYSIKMFMSNDNGRGFTWGVAGAKPIAALNAVSGNMQIAGSFAAASKSFLIPHPTKEGWKLRYGSLEGPENGVYVRGKLKGGNVIELPGYWTKLVDPDSITVQLTPIGKHQKLYVEDIRDNKVYIANDGLFAGEINCFYYVQGERVDIEKLVVEYE